MWVRISPGSSAIPSEDFHGVSQPLQENARVELHLDRGQFVSNNSRFIIHQSSYHPTLYNVDI
jgi:hypothetical protein